jgi:cephalosporin-C deacetylase-like acetyl esterase
MRAKYTFAMHSVRSLLVLMVTISSCFTWAQNVPAEWAKMFSYDSSAPLDLKERVYDNQPSATVYDIDFVSPKGGRVTGFLVMPTSSGSHPGVVFAHWGQGDKLEFLPEALLYARAGVASVMIDYPWVRPQPWRRPLFTAQTSDDQDKATEIQAIIDLRRSFDVLRQQSGIDAGRIAYVGHSFGAQFGAILAAIDKRMAASVLITGAPSYRSISIDGKSPDVVALQQQAGMQALGKAEKVMNALDGIRYVPFAAPVPLLFQFARYEPSFSKEAMQAYFDAASQPKAIRWYPAGHELNDVNALIERANWIADQLRVPALRSVIADEFKSRSGVVVHQP